MIKSIKVAIPVPWEGSPSGCVEWRLVDWTLEDDGGQRLPILDDGWGDVEPQAWASDYAIEDPQTGGWRFPDGEQCGDEDLATAFERRRGRH